MSSLSLERIIRRCLSPLLLLLAVAGCGDGTPSPPAPTYGVSGTVVHLDSGNLMLSNGGETITVAQGATGFVFAKGLADGTAYNVTVSSQPAGENCVLANAAGTVKGAAVTNIAVTCNTVVSQPLAIGVSAANNTRIFLPVRVGTGTATVNTILDTGSTGTGLRAQDIFPSSMVSTSGFVFPAGQASITYNGITVTNLVATRTYGSQSDSPTQQTGNIGFAQMTLGTGVQATTAVMPILFIYQTSVGGAAPTVPSIFANIVGVNPEMEALTINDAKASTLMPCTMQSTSTCGAVSPFRYLTYASGIDEGFVLNKVVFTSCTENSTAGCSTSPNLVLGVTGDTLARFTTTSLDTTTQPCRSVMILTSVEPICSQLIQSVTVSSGNASFVGPAIFDSGAPTTRLVYPTGMSFPDNLPLGTAYRIATSGFAYQFVSGTDYITVIQAGGTSGFTNSGIQFFAQNSLIVDYQQKLEGWHNQ